MISRSKPFSFRCRRLPCFVAVAIVLVLLCGCGGGGTRAADIHGDGKSGVRGIAMTVNADGTPLAPLPNAIITVQTQTPGPEGGAYFQGPVLAQTQADAQGNFSIALRPDVYGIGGNAAQPGNYVGGAVYSLVPTGQFAQVTVQFFSPNPDFHGDGTSGVSGTAMTVGSDGTPLAPLPNAIITVQSYYGGRSGGKAKDPPIFEPIVAQTQADAQGNFSIALVPGVYDIGGKAAQPGNYVTYPHSATVSKSQFTRLTVPFTAPKP